MRRAPIAVAYFANDHAPEMHAAQHAFTICDLSARNAIAQKEIITHKKG